MHDSSARLDNKVPSTTGVVAHEGVDGAPHNIKMDVLVATLQIEGVGHLRDCALESYTQRLVDPCTHRCFGMETQMVAEGGAVAGIDVATATYGGDEILERPLSTKIGGGEQQ